MGNIMAGDEDFDRYQALHKSLGDVMCDSLRDKSFEVVKAKLRHVEFVAEPKQAAANDGVLTSAPKQKPSSHSLHNFGLFTSPGYKQDASNDEGSKHSPFKK